MRRNSKSKKAQGSLEYLVILASVLAVSAIVVLFMSGTFGTTGADVSGCKSAAGTCAAKLVTTYSPPCPACDTACVDSSGKDMMSKTTGCGGACTLCKLGEPMRISSSGWQPHELEPDSSTAGLWHFNEGGSGTTADSSGNGNTGTINGATWNPAGKFSSALAFDGVDDSVSLSSQPSLTNGFTFSAWVKRGSDSPVTQEIFNNNQFFLRTRPEAEDASNPFEAFVKLSDSSTEPRVVSNVASTIGEWFFVTVTWNKTTLKIYVNGELKGSSTRSGSLTPTTVTAQIGRGEGGSISNNPFSGTIDEVAISSRAKSDAEIWVDANA